MEIRQATINDLEKIMEVAAKTVKIMNEEGNDQWSDKYPAEKDFKADIENSALFVAFMDDKVVGSIAIDRIGGKNYDLIEWTLPDNNYYVIHRLMVDPEIRGGGIASKLLSFAEVFARENDTFYLKTDTYAINEKAQNLFLKNGFNKVGELHFPGKERPFYCFDKTFK
ncbi:GNAT family N-acetyltransferase [Niallia taxi]|uniref:GNAT family N-acetyltransferase n=1 Tax=Niallia taxi TaxID=2499688 RepID=UPI0011A1B44E|nr:GNAT family N-acetyltransferase [Niallia taxi]MCT2344677.1 GNAT family N-acetyltransferase [Niallia taxi]MDE5053509.1 GNAT family N-acetyltransferase [Niallia taxi]MED3961731.1 GNAT family N-acetyltransferase [Niallia taxi]WOD61150.1 GNAT family N-acetyltransferase [Niallia taxi]